METAPDYSATAGDGSSGSKPREKFQRAFERYRVPGASPLGPLLMTTQFTASMLPRAVCELTVVRPELHRSGC